MTKILLLNLCIAAVTASTSQAVITWTGAADSDPFNDSNWDFTSSTSTEILSSTPINDDVFVGNVGNAASGGDGIFAQFELGSGFSMTIASTSFILNNINGISGTSGGPVETFNLVNSTAELQFIGDATLVLDSTSSVNILGVTNPFFSGNTGSLNLSEGGASATFDNTTTINEQIGNGNIFVGGTLVTVANRASLLTTSGFTITAVAVPEPSSTALLGLGGLALMLRRRR